MKIIFGLFFSVTFVVVTTSTIGQHVDKGAHNRDAFHRSQIILKFPRCGSTFVSDTGGVFYKAFESILPNERCVWLVGVPKAKGYTIEIQYLGSPTNQPSSGQGLLITGVGFDNNTNGVPTQTKVIPTSQGKFSVSNSNLMVITFYSSSSSSNVSTGFALQWDTQYSGNVSETAATSSHFLLESPLFNFQYPVLPTNKYSANELSSFVFPPGRNFYHCGNEKYTYLRIIRLRENNSFVCNDALHIFHFNATANIWNNAGRVCNPTKNITIAHDDLTLILFQTIQPPSANETANGFVLSYTAC